MSSVAAVVGGMVIAAIGLVFSVVAAVVKVRAGDDSDRSVRQVRVLIVSAVFAAGLLVIAGQPVLQHRL